jgi:hypothetical protein
MMIRTTLRRFPDMVAVFAMLAVGGAKATGAPDDPPLPEPRKATATDQRHSLNSLKQILLAVHNYHDTYGHFPTDITDKAGKPLLSWRVAILPYIEQENLFRQFKLDESWDSEHNLPLSKIVIKIYHGADVKIAPLTYYQVFTGPGTPFPAGKKSRLANIVDGTSNTIGVIEAGPPVPWTKPADIAYDPKQPLPKFTGPFSNQLHLTMFDGSAWAVRRDIPERELRHLIEAGDGNVVQPISTYRPKRAADTPEEKKELAAAVEANSRMIAEMEVLLKDHLVLLKKKALAAKSLEEATDQGERLQQMIEAIKAENQQMRVKLGLEGARPGPRPVQK